MPSVLDGRMDAGIGRLVGEGGPLGLTDVTVGGRTYPAIAAAKRLLWIVTGEEKREPLAKMMSADPSIPAGRIEFTESVVVADSAAVG